MYSGLAKALLSSLSTCKMSDVSRFGPKDIQPVWPQSLNRIRLRSAKSSSKLDFLLSLAQSFTLSYVLTDVIV